jgi:hypothetical protein
MDWKTSYVTHGFPGRSGLAADAEPALAIPFRVAAAGTPTAIPANL